MGVRRERVVLELEDDFTAKLARAAAAAQVFQKSLGKTRGESDRTSQSLSKADRDTQKFSATVTRSTRELDSYSGRLGLVASAIGTIGPALIPITAVAIPAVTGLAQSFGFAAAAGGTAILAFQGVGDALSAMNKAHLNPTISNLEKAQQAMAQLSPAAQTLVLKLESMRDELKKLKDAAGSGILPGATQALSELESRLPAVQRIIHNISQAAGQALREGAASLAGPEWDKFFHFIEHNARPELAKFAATVGRLAHGFAELWVAFGPLNRGFSTWLLQSARAFDQWATGLSATDGFKEFIAYIRENGPKVGDAVAAIGNALLQIVEAAAPIGGPVLDALTGVANIIAKIADSDLGTPIIGAVAAFSALNLVMKTFGVNAVVSARSFVTGQVQAVSAIRSTTASMINLNAVSLRNIGTTAGLVAGNAKVASSLKTIGTGAAVFGALALVSSGATQKVGLTNTAMLGLAGTMLGPWGAAAGAGIGLTLDLAKANDSLADSIDRANGAASNPANLQQLVAARRDLVSNFANMTNDESGPFGFFGKGRRMISFLSGDVGQTQHAIAALDGQIRGSRGENARYAAALDLTGRGFQLATASAEGFAAAVSGLDATLAKRASLRDYRQSLRDLRQSIKDNGKALNTGSAAADKNQAALDGVVDKILKVAEHMKGANRIEFLKRARADLLETAGKLDGGKAAVERLTASIDHLNTQHAKPSVEVDTREAFSQLSVFEQRLADLTGKRRTVYINEVHESIFGTPATPPPFPGMVPHRKPKGTQPVGDPTVTHRADGGIVTGRGGPRDDMIDARLSDGEFVVNAFATARHRDLLEQINAQKFADGGYASRDLDTMRYQSRQGHHSATNKMTVSLGDLRVVGTLQTPWGPAQVEGIARAAARDEVNDSAALDRTHAGMFRGGVRG
jgi:hypothetical protein